MSRDPLYIEVANHIAEKIIKGEIASPTVLEAKLWSEQVGLNLGAVQQALEFLESVEVLRSVDKGFVPSLDSQVKALAYRKERLVYKDLKEAFSKCKLLGINPQELKDSYSNYLETQP